VRPGAHLSSAAAGDAQRHGAAHFAQLPSWAASRGLGFELLTDGTGLLRPTANTEGQAAHVARAALAMSQEFPELRVAVFAGYGTARQHESAFLTEFNRIEQSGALGIRLSDGAADLLNSQFEVRSDSLGSVLLGWRALGEAVTGGNGFAVASPPSVEPNTATPVWLMIELA